MEAVSPILDSNANLYGAVLAFPDRSKIPKPYKKSKNNHLVTITIKQLYR